jgi:hypothetical protein
MSVQGWRGLGQFKAFCVVRASSHSGSISSWKVFFLFLLDILSDWDYHILIFLEGLRLENGKLCECFFPSQGFGVLLLCSCSFPWLAFNAVVYTELKIMQCHYCAFPGVPSDCLLFVVYSLLYSHKNIWNILQCGIEVI